MAFTISAVSIAEVGAYGGTLMSITGDFSAERESDFRVHVGPNGDSTDPACYAGPGRRDLAQPISDTELRVYLPKLEPTTGTAYDVFVQLVGGGSDSLSEEITVYPPQFQTSVFAMRSVLPPTWAVGPRNVDLVPIDSTWEGALWNGEAITLAVGGSDNEIGGLNQTRVTQVATTGATTLNVENVLGWPDSGKIKVGGVIYAYGSRTSQTIDDITHIFGGVVQVGTFKDHEIKEAVTDITGAVSAIEQVRRAMIVDYAEAEDLNALGRNLGVLRLPFLTGDDQYRDIIKALAYNPRGTRYGLDLALTAMVGAGNYEVFEDPINSPATVFIKLPAALLAGTISQGKYFVDQVVPRPASAAQTIPLGTTPLSVGGCTLKPELIETDCRIQKPSGHVIEEYDGDTGTQLWTFTGDSEVDDVTLVSGQYIDIISGADDNAYYEHPLRLTANGAWELAVTLNVYGNLSGFTDGRAVMGAVANGDRWVAWGCFGAGAGEYELAFMTSAGAKIGSGVTLNINEWHAVQMFYRPDKLTGWDWVYLVVDEQFIQGGPISTVGSVTSSRLVRFGANLVGEAEGQRIKEVNVTALDPTEYWDNETDCSVATANPTRVVSAGAFVVSDDEGKTFQILESSVTNPQGGDNRGQFVVDSVTDVNTIEVLGLSGADATVNATNPTRITIDDRQDTFRFPQDLGKTVQLSGSGAGNDGTWTITKLLDRDTLVDLSTFDTPLDSVDTNVCEVIGTFTTESNLAWQIRPVFVTEASIAGRLSDAGSFTGSTATLRDSLPAVGGGWPVVNMLMSEVLTGQLVDQAAENALISETPLKFEWYPVYLSDPLAYVRIYITELLAAGVIPEFILE